MVALIVVSWLEHLLFVTVHLRDNNSHFSDGLNDYCWLEVNQPSHSKDASLMKYRISLFVSIFCLSVDVVMLEINTIFLDKSHIFIQNAL